MISIEFLITSLIVVLIPGTGVLFTISTALVQGRKASVYAALGCTLGIVPHLIATVFGLAAIMHTSAVAFSMLKYAGALYLFYLAVMTWRDNSMFAVDENSVKIDALPLVMKAFLLNILNPKLTIFFLAFLPQFVPHDSVQPIVQMLFLSGVFMAMTLIVFIFYGFLAHLFRKAVIESPRIQARLKKSFSAVFAGLSVQLALSNR
ncbi:MAG: LysE family translocator [Sulfurospirillaceae bacterium]|nr:LysE family translocator [Sulfurospirillaceae bacterium]